MLIRAVLLALLLLCGLGSHPANGSSISVLPGAWGSDAARESTSTSAAPASVIYAGLDGYDALRASRTSAAKTHPAALRAGGAATQGSRSSKSSISLRRATKGGRGAADDVADAACSFSGETLVLMADGTKKPISQVNVGDKVLATDPLTGQRSARRVTHVWVHTDRFIRLNAGGEWITTTEDHPFWNQTGETWESAGSLESGDLVRKSDGRLVSVRKLALRAGGPGTAYNLTVQGVHTFHIGGLGLLVHNTCKVRRPWRVTPEGTAARAQHPRFGSFSKSKSDGLWWSRDQGGHASVWKVFEETPTGLRWRADADQFGDFIMGKHKGPTGQFIPWKEFGRR